MKQCTNKSCQHWYERSSVCPRCKTTYTEEGPSITVPEGKANEVLGKIRMKEIRADGSTIDRGLIEVAPSA